MFILWTPYTVMDKPSCGFPETVPDRAMPRRSYSTDAMATLTGRGSCVIKFFRQLPIEHASNPSASRKRRF